MDATSFIVDDGRGTTFGVIHLADVDRSEFRELTPAQRCVYTTLCLFVGRESGKCWPKVSTLMRITGFSRSTVFRALDSLEERHYLHRSKRRFLHTQVNVYTLTTPP